YVARRVPRLTKMLTANAIFDHLLYKEGMFESQTLWCEAVLVMCGRARDVQSAVVHSARQQWSGCANAAISGAGKPGKPAYQEAGCTEQWVGVAVLISPEADNRFLFQFAWHARGRHADSVTKAFRDESVEAPLRREAEGGEP
ncbi:hypothetical protein JOQ06_026731, partial [Pogonophryne albipinna]